MRSAGYETGSPQLSLLSGSLPSGFRSLEALSGSRTTSVTPVSASLTEGPLFHCSGSTAFTESVSGVYETSNRSAVVSLEPLATFEYQVVDRWLPSVAPERSEELRDLYRAMKTKGEVRVTTYEASQLWDLNNRNKIQWCEPKCDGDKLLRIQLPMDPSFDLLGNEAGGPVIFIKDRFDPERFTVMNGNHRTMAVMSVENPTTQSLFVMEFKSHNSCQRLLNTSPDVTYTNVEIPHSYTF